HFHLNFFVVLSKHMLVSSPNHPITKEHLTLMCKVDRWNFNIFSFDIFPNIQFSPIGNWETTNILPIVDFAIQHIKQLWTLVFLIPLTEIISNGENPFFSSGLFFISPSSTDTSIKFEFLDGIQKRSSLKGISTGISSTLLTNFTLIDRILHVAYDQL